MADPGEVVARLVRNDVVESVHHGHVVVCAADGTVLAARGDADRLTYVRSAVKPFQAVAVLDLLASAGKDLTVDGLAIACASHDGSDDQQIEAARLLAEADLEESALQCPPAVPREPATAYAQRWPYPLSHNCSGKHAAFLLATVAVGADPASYLALDNPVQQRAREVIEECCGAPAQGPGIDGCGAPAWLLPLRALATGFARLAAGATPRLERVRDAMSARPALVGGTTATDSRLMLGDPALVAKRGAEAVFGVGMNRGAASLGVAVKITDGGTRADAPAAAAVLQALGASVDEDLVRPPVLGGGVAQGALEVDIAVAALGRTAAAAG
ncbi:MAG TPA: asparaginase [Egibacteraceae bacterium]|nr:asparaginase [Egibacteraceae bacterium]